MVSALPGICNNRSFVFQLCNLFSQKHNDLVQPEVVPPAAPDGLINPDLSHPNILLIPKASETTSEQEHNDVTNQPLTDLPIPLLIIEPNAEAATPSIRKDEHVNKSFYDLRMLEIWCVIVAWLVALSVTVVVFKRLMFFVRKRRDWADAQAMFGNKRRRAKSVQAAAFSKAGSSSMKRNTVGVSEPESIEVVTVSSLIRFPKLVVIMAMELSSI
jgi:hypothetical protein